MKLDCHRLLAFTALIGIGSLLWAPAFTTAQTTPAAESEGPRETETVAAEIEHISIDFNNVDITVFVKFISELTGTNFVVDPRVKGKVTIISPNRISLDEAYRVFQSVLEIHGYTTVRAGEVTKIIPKPDARTKNIQTMLEDEAMGPEDKVVTQLIPLKFADVERVRALFTPLVSKSSVMLAYPATNTLIVTDVYSNITRLLGILTQIDVMGIGRELSVVPLQHADVSKMEKILSTVFRSARRTKKKGAVPEQTLFVGDERTNSLIIHASEVETVRIKKLIELLDMETPRGSERIRVYYLENANAEDLVKVLMELPSKKGDDAKKGKAAVVSEKVRITADKATNSLIIMAEKDDYDVLEEVIAQLDIPRSMVYIESLIMEVTVDKDFSIGTEWIAFDQVSIDGRPAAAGGGFSGQADFGNIAGVVLPGEGGTASLPPGFSLGVFSSALEIGGITFPNLNAVAHAFRKDKDVNILSTPQILTTDNEEATITVGKNVPFQTRSAAQNATETYSSFEYRDVGITLKITPQISKGRMVRLTIDQVVERVDELVTLATTTDRPTTFKRSIQTTVLVKDKSTVVIGGLIDEATTDTETKVPCLGDFPGLGWLFKARTEGEEKSNLFIFITPYVVNRPEEAIDIYQRKRENIEGVRGGKVKMYPDAAGDPSSVPGIPRSPKQLPDME